MFPYPEDMKKEKAKYDENMTKETGATGGGGLAVSIGVNIHFI
jgi:hypothetical protein